MEVYRRIITQGKKLRKSPDVAHCSSVRATKSRSSATRGLVALLRERLRKFVTTSSLAIAMYYCVNVLQLCKQAYELSFIHLLCL